MPANYRNAVCYLDTNVLIYAFDTADTVKQQLSKELLRYFPQNRSGRISIQVLSEWRNAMIKKYSQLVDATLRREFIRNMGVWQPLAISPQILIKADELSDRYRFSPYDAIHVQCALELGCR